MNQPQSIAIIGAGLSGLALSLALYQQGIHTVVYESRPEPSDIGGAVMLSPNALRILDALHIYQPILERGYDFDTLEFRTEAGNVVDIYEFGDKGKYGYSGNRLYRHELVDIMLDAVRAAGIQVMYGRKFSKVVSETDDNVTFEFIDGTKTTASALVGADGIHSTVRRYMYRGPDYEPRFVGMAGFSAAVPSSNLPEDVRVDKPLTIMSKTVGSFVVAPQKADGSELFIGKQKRIPGNPTRDEWNSIFSNKQSVIDYLQSNNEAFGQIAISAASKISPDKVNIWPFYVVPPLPSWASQNRRVILVGDAAHAIPPSAGQGISQAMEDVYMLALLMGEVNKGKAEMGAALGFWQEFRQGRVGQVYGLCKKVDQWRLPREKDAPELEQGNWELGWLYGIDIKEVVKDWVRKK